LQFNNATNSPIRQSPYKKSYSLYGGRCLVVALLYFFNSTYLLIFLYKDKPFAKNSLAIPSVRGDIEILGANHVRNNLIYSIEFSLNFAIVS
jgi:hypothetical protein